MLLAIDIGNTSTAFGLFRGKRLVKAWRCATKRVIDGIKFIKGKKGGDVGAVVIASVVPRVNARVKQVIVKKFGVRPLFVTHKNAGIEIGYLRPREVGADRLVDAVAAWRRYKKACIVVDFGTATTLEYIDGNGIYWGGPIAPGIGIANRVLYEAAERLPMTRLVPGGRMLPRSTREAIQTGVYQGYIGLVEHLVRKMVREVGGRPKVIATGGLAPLIKKGTDLFDDVDPLLTLKGLQMIWGALNEPQ
jgi:type III pantothenate kinase